MNTQKTNYCKISLKPDVVVAITVKTNRISLLDNNEWSSFCRQTLSY